LFIQITLHLHCKDEKIDDVKGNGSSLLWEDWRIILEWIFRKWDVEAWTGLSWVRIQTGGGHL
jgi:hypothetical protein